MAAEIQSKFLRVLDSGTFYRVGATRKRRADFRLVAATNRNLRDEVAAGRFRKDLFFRIHGVQVQIPPLRDRPEDISLLVEHFAKALPAAKTFSPAAIRALESYDWPGNVRELHFAVERAGLLSEHDTLDVGDLPPEITEKEPKGAHPPAPTRGNGDGSEREEPDQDEAGFDPARIKAALEEAHWRRGRAAEILNVSPRTLYRWLKRLDL